MIYSEHKETKDNVVEMLLHKRCTVKELHQRLSEKGTTCSLQAVYDAVRSLIHAGVVIKQKTQYVVSSEWKKNVIREFYDIPAEPVLEPGESQRYIFRSVSQLDKFWKHTNAVFMNMFEEEPFFFYDPHEFWLHIPGQIDSQRTFLQGFNQDNRLGVILIGDHTPLDQTYKQNMQDYVQVHLDASVHFRRTEHITVVNDFIVVTKIPIDVAEQIDSVYQSTTSEEQLQRELQHIFAKEMRMTVTVTNNRQKAKKLRKRIARDVYVPLSLRKQFDLY